jgi:allantoin racemase
VAGPRRDLEAGRPVTGGRELRVRVVSPLGASPDDLARRQRRYQEHAGPGTVVTVANLQGGPAALDSAADVEASAAAMLAQERLVGREGCDAILVDCVFDPAVAAIGKVTSVPTFGPTHLTLPRVTAVARGFSIVARSQAQCELLAELVDGYGFGHALRSLRALGITYEEAKRPEVFEAAMGARLRDAVRRDGAEAVVMGSTTMALSPALLAAAGGVPLFMPGLEALSAIEERWRLGSWPGPA